MTKDVIITSDHKKRVSFLKLNDPSLQDAIVSLLSEI